MCSRLGAVGLCLAMMCMMVWAYGEDVDTDRYDIGKKISIRAGLFRPSDSSTADLLGSEWTDFRLGLTQYKSDTSAILVELGFIQSRKADLSEIAPGTTARIQMIPLTFIFLVKPAPEAKTYYGAGIGPYFITADVKSDAGALTKTAAKLGLQVVLGLTMSQDYIAEMRYGKIFTGDSSADGLSVAIGARY